MDGRPCTRGGEEESIPVVDVGIGVGYLLYRASLCEGEDRACLLNGRGRPGELESGSNAGSSDGAGRFTPATRGKLEEALSLLGEESIRVDINKSSKPNGDQSYNTT
jgi:hypothetical protein